MSRTSKKTNLAREFRQGQTDAEKALWLRLKNRQLDGVKFRRQQPLGPYIVDFVSFERRIVVEVDGGQHNEPSHFAFPLEGGGGERARDEERTAWLRKGGYQVLRFWNNEVLMNMEGVLERIVEALR
jgi:very-short-patch-repair endonuclease